MNFIARSPKTKLNVIMCLYELLKYAKLSGYIQAMPDFPSKEDYNLIEKPIEWIPYDVQLQVIDAIPEHHRPIFKFMMLHYRREGEGARSIKRITTWSIRLLRSGAGSRPVRLLNRPRRRRFT